MYPEISYVLMVNETDSIITTDLYSIESNIRHYFNNLYSWQGGSFTDFFLRAARFPTSEETHGKHDTVKIIFPNSFTAIVDTYKYKKCSCVNNVIFNTASDEIIPTLMFYTNPYILISVNVEENSKKIRKGLFLSIDYSYTDGVFPTCLRR